MKRNLCVKCRGVCTMRLDLAAEELREIGRELRKQCRLLALRRKLRFLLVGFLIGRHADRKIRELAARNELIIKRIKGHFEELLTACKQVNEVAGRGREQYFVALASLEADVGWLVASRVLEEEYVLSVKEGFEAIRRSVSECVKGFIESRLATIRGQVEAIQNSGTYLIASDKERAIASLKLVEDEVDCFGMHVSLGIEFVSATTQTLQEYRRAVLDYNEDFVEQRKKEYDYLFKKGKLSLDDEQQTAVITDDKHNLVIAGAGAGKTEVLITRIAYLIERKPDGVQPSRILAIAHQNKDVRQIERRLHERYNIDDVEVKTFHKLGKEILQKAGRKSDRSSIVDENKKHEIMRALYQRRLDEPDFYKLFLQYVKAFHDDEGNNRFEDEVESLAYAQGRAYFSINNTPVKSRAEKEIMDFLLMNELNGEPVAVEYEPDLPGFRPDFGLPKYDLFIEHWALNERGEVPEWFDQTTEDYKEKMRFKKEWFDKNNKLLVETFAYEYDEASPEGFIELLRSRIVEKLQTRNEGRFEFEPLAYNELVEVAWGPYKDPVDEIVIFITNAKTYGLSPDRIVEKLRNGKWSRKQLAFGNLAVRIYADYRDYLVKQGKIDFEDMVNDAIAELDKDRNLCANVYDHVLIDEYQDISAQRYKLIKKLLERNSVCKLFCVGDDWQSIMAFSGSNLDFFVNFEKYFENPALTKISTNYRSTRTIVDAGAELMKKNGDCQISKTTLSSRDEGKAITVFRSPHKENYRMRYYEQTAEDCLTHIAEYIRKGLPPREILVLSRFMRTKAHRAYKFHHVIRVLLDKAQEMGIDMICDDARDKSKIRVLSVHKSKGLEAKAVFILNVIKDAYGFPCEIEDSSIHAPARENYPEQDPKEEERRLFYVAMTRAREDLIIYTWEPSKSEFLEEIQSYTQEERLSY